MKYVDEFYNYLAKNKVFQNSTNIKIIYVAEADPVDYFLAITHRPRTLDVHRQTNDSRID